MAKRIAALWFIAAVMAVLTVVALPADRAVAQQKSLEWTRLDCDITVLPNGDLRIIETNVVNFTSGSFTNGYRDIKMDQLTAVSAVEVTENGRPLTFETAVSGGNTRITYHFSPATGQRRTFVIAYTVSGATRYDPSGDQVRWIAVYPDRNGYPVLDSRVSVRLPEGAAATDVTVNGARASVSGPGKSVVNATALEGIPSGEQLEIVVLFPHGIVAREAAPAPSTANMEPSLDTGLEKALDMWVTLLALLIAAGGTGLVLAVWLLHGREPQAAEMTGVVTEPPRGISPGVTDELLNDVDVFHNLDQPRAVLATLMDMVRRGVLDLTETGDPTLQGKTDWVFRRGAQFGSATRAFEKCLITILELDRAQECRLSEFNSKFSGYLRWIAAAFKDELVQGGYYSAWLVQARQRFMRSPVPLLALGLGSLFLLTWAPFYLAPRVVLQFGTPYLIPIACLIAGIAFRVIGAKITSLTPRGAETAMRLAAFKRYLEHVDQYADLESITDQFDRYLPYAIALGVERIWIRKFAAVNTPAPTWYVRAGAGQDTSLTSAVENSARLKAISPALEALLSRAAATLESVTSSASAGGIR